MPDLIHARCPTSLEDGGRPQATQAWRGRGA
jgi:hypothetical protein